MEETDVPEGASLDELERAAKEMTRDGGLLSPELADRINRLRQLRLVPCREGFSSASEIAGNLAERIACKGAA